VATKFGHAAGKESANFKIQQFQSEIAQLKALRDRDRDDSFFIWLAQMQSRLLANSVRASTQPTSAQLMEMNQKLEQLFVINQMLEETIQSIERSLHYIDGRSAESKADALLIVADVQRSSFMAESGTPL
jgi:hypothetical protein